MQSLMAGSQFIQGITMFDIENKDFREDLRHLIAKVKSQENFAFSKYADGELHILANKPIANLA